MKFAPDGYVFMFGTFALTLLLAAENAQTKRSAGAKAPGRSAKKQGSCRLRDRIPA